jgi:hypothetical protein
LGTVRPIIFNKLKDQLRNDRLVQLARYNSYSNYDFLVFI